MKRRAAGTNAAVTYSELRGESRGEAARRIEGCLKGRTGRESNTAKDRQMKKMRRETTDGKKTTNIYKAGCSDMSPPAQVLINRKQ